MAFFFRKLTEITFKHRAVVILAAAVFFCSAITSQSPPKYREALELYNSGDFQKSLDIIRSIFAENSNSYELRMLAAADYSRLGNYESALQHLQYCMKDHPDRVEPKIFISGVMRKSGRLLESIRIARLGLAQHGENLPLRLELARSLYKVGQYVPARQMLDRILIADPKNFDAFYLDGLIYLRQGNYETAEFRLRNAVQYRPSDRNQLKDLYNNLGVALEKNGDRILSQGNKQQAMAVYNDAKSQYETARDSGSDTAVKNLERLSQKMR